MSNGQPHHYNPDWLDDDALIAGFIARQNEFKFLRDELARAPREGSVQHYLLVGPRGAGKTTLLKRLAVAIRREDELRDHLIALSFPEELYQVKNLDDFWWAACEALADELDRLGQKAQADRLFNEIDRVRAVGGSSAVDSNAGLEKLLTISADIQRRPVLLVDNLDLVFERIDKKGRKLKDPLSPAYWALREALSTTASPIVIGGSVRLSEPFIDYDKAFYDFFLPKRLGKLTLADVRKVIEHLADQQGNPEVKTRLNERPARIETLYELTGGNPRAIGFIFQLLRQGPNGRAVEDFERLMDLTTPYYKARFEDLSEQAQVVMHALAVRRPSDGSALRFGHTAAEIAAHASLPTNTVSAQMDVLEREGLVEKSAAHGRTQYRIAEQLFRLWLQMRGTRRIRQNVIGLAEFLEAMYDTEELTAQLQHAGNGLIAARLAFAVADTRGAAPLRRGLEAYAADCLHNDTRGNSGEYEELLPAGDLNEDLQAIVQLRQKLAQCQGGGLNQAEQEALLGSLELRLDQKQASVDALCQPNTAPQEAARLRAHFPEERKRLLRDGLLDSDLPLLYQLRAKGQLPTPWLTAGDADAVLKTDGSKSLKPMLWRLAGTRNRIKFSAASAEAWLSWGLRHATDASATEWANVAGAMRRSKQLEIAARALEQAFLRGESSRTWHERASLLSEIGNDASEAEATYRKAIELDPTCALPWNNLGVLLAEKLAYPAEAEAAFRKAIELDPTYALPWNNLGGLLAEQLARPDEAEAAYRKAIEFNPTYAEPWNGLGILLAEKLARPDEAEAAYRKAVELDPTFVWPWYNLGCLLAEQQDRHAETEEAYRKATEIAPTETMPWNNLGCLLADKLARPAEAEEAYRKAISLDPSLGIAWGNLGRLLEAQARYSEAETAYRQAVSFDDQNAAYWQAAQTRMAERQAATSAGKALRIGNIATAREELNKLVADSDKLAATLAGEGFVENLLAPALRDKEQASTLLGLLWGMGLDKHARPLLLAFEAAIEKRPEALDDLEPEVRGAARHMFERLTAASRQQQA